MNKWSAKVMAAIDVQIYINKSRFIAESLYITPLHDGYVLVTFLNDEPLPCEHIVENGECIYCRIAIEEKIDE